MDNVLDKEELKAIIWPIVVAVMIFGLAFFAWLNSDMYRDEKESQWLQVQNYLLQTYYMGSMMTDDERAELMTQYNLTDDDINPTKIMERFRDDE